MFELFITYDFNGIVTRSTGVLYHDYIACQAAMITALNDLFMISAGCVPV